MIKKEILSALKTVPETIEGVSHSRRYAAREVIEFFESACFSIFFSYCTGETPDKRAVSLVCRTHDWMERFNRLGDENSRDPNISQPFWQRWHIAEELGALEVEASNYIRSKYRGNEALRRSAVVTSAYEDYVLTTCAVEDFLTGRRNVSQMKPKEVEMLGRLPEVQGEELVAEYRYINDRKWLEVLTLLLADGDSELADRSIDKFMAGVMLFQLSDDYAYSSRNKIVGKKAFFVEGEATVGDLRRQGRRHLDNLGLPSVPRQVIEALWVARSLRGKAAMKDRNDERYSNDDQFDEVNQFEENIAFVRLRDFQLKRLSI